MLALTVTYICCVAISNPSGDFPIGDDYIYNEAVKQTLQAHTLKLYWSAQACYLHIFLGAAIAKIFGFSYLALRVHNMFWTIFGALGLLLAFRTIGLSPLMSTGFAALYLFNPIIYWLSFTFMTDAMSLSLTNWFLYLTLLGLRNRSLTNIAGGSVLLMISLASRLFSAVFAVSSATAAVLNWRGGVRSWALLALCLFGPLAVVMGLPAIFRLTDPAMASVSLATMGIDISNFVILLLHHPVPMLWRVLVACGQLSIYLGVFCAPLMTALICHHLEKNLRLNRVAWVTATVIMTGTIATLVGHNEKLMPFVSNTLYPPWTCIPAVMGFPSSWYHEYWAGITAVCSLWGFAFIVVSADFTWRTLKQLFLQMRHSAKRNQLVPAKRDTFTLASLLVSFAFVSLIIVAHDNDRYYTLALAPALLLVGLIWRKFRLNRPLLQWTFATMLAGIVLYSVASVHDCLESFRARYHAIVDLEHQGISPKRIDGGWEYDMMHTPELIKTMHAIPGGWKIALSDRGTPPLNNQRWWPCLSDEYVISQKEYDGYTVFKRYPYRNWVLRCPKEMLVLKKNPEPRP